MKVMFPRLTAAIFDRLFDPKYRSVDSHKAYNDHLDEETGNPLRHIPVEVNDAMLDAGYRAALEVKTYGEADLYTHECLYRAYVAMERVRRMQSVIPPDAVCDGEE